MAFGGLTRLQAVAVDPEFCQTNQLFYCQSAPGLPRLFCGLFCTLFCSLFCSLFSLFLQNIQVPV